MALTKKQLQKRGPKGHKLAHITPLEAVILKALGGSGKVNPRTKLRQYDTEVKTDKEKAEDSSSTNESLSDYGADTGTNENLGSNDSQTESNINLDGTPSEGYNESEPAADSQDVSNLDISLEEDLGGDKHDTENGTTTTTTTTTNDDDNDNNNDNEPPPEPPPVYTDWKGVEYDNPEDAEAANAGYLATGKTDLIGSAEGFDQDLSGDYKTVYEQQLSDAYDAAYAGVGQDILNRGGGDGTEYEALEALQGGQEDYLTELANNYQAEAKLRYDNWLATNTAAINAITGENAEGVSALDQIKNYKWSTMPEYDTDLSGGYDEDGVFQEDWMPEFYKDSNKVYGKKYKKPSGWEYDADGNPIPGSAGTDTSVNEAPEPEGIVIPEPGEKMRTAVRGSGGIKSKTRSSAKYY